MELNQIIKERYSVRNFKEDSIEKEKITELLETLNYVPTATNNQPERIYVLKSKEALEKVTKVANTFKAPLVLLVCSDVDAAWHSIKEDYNSSEMDSSIATTYLMLKAWDLGISSVWIRLFDSKKVKEVFSLPENIKPICFLALGYASEEAKPSPKHYEKKPLDNLIKYL